MSAEQLPTLEDLEKEEADPTVAMLVTPDGDFIRYIRQSEYEKMGEQ